MKKVILRAFEISLGIDVKGKEKDDERRKKCMKGVKEALAKANDATQTLKQANG